MSNSQAPNATVQGEILLAKYLTDSIRSIEQAIRKAAPPGATLPRSLSAPRLDLRGNGRRAATEVLLPRKLPVSYAPAAAAAAAHAATRRDDVGQLLGGAPRPGVVMTQARLLQPGQPGYNGSGLQPPRSHGGAGVPPLPKSSPAPPLPPRPAVVRTAHAVAAAALHHEQQQQSYAARGLGGGGGAAAGRSTSAPRLDEGARSHSHHHHHHHHHHHNSHSQQQPSHLSSPAGGHHRHLPGPAVSEARIPAVSAAPPLGGGLMGPGGAAGVPDARSAASVRKGALSDAGSHSSWWRWRPVTDASYPLTAITDRYAQSMTPTELVKWNDRVARLEAEITQEKERRRHFEEQLKKLQVATVPGALPGAAAGGGRATMAAGAKGTGMPFR